MWKEEPEKMQLRINHKLSYFALLNELDTQKCSPLGIGFSGSDFTMSVRLESKCNYCQIMGTRKMLSKRYRMDGNIVMHILASQWAEEEDYEKFENLFRQGMRTSTHNLSCVLCLSLWQIRLAVSHQYFGPVQISPEHYREERLDLANTCTNCVFPKLTRDNDIEGCFNTYTESTFFTPKLRNASLPLSPDNSVINRIDQYACRVIRFPSLLTAGCNWVSTGALDSVAASWAQMRHDDAFVVGRLAE